MPESSSESYGGPTDGPDEFDEDWGMDGDDPECCWMCMGEGGWHDCGEDCCPCLDKSINEICPECDGEGWL